MTRSQKKTALNRRLYGLVALAGALVLGSAGVADAAPSDAARCVATRLKIVGKAVKDAATCESKLALKIDHGSFDASGQPMAGIMDPDKVGSLLAKREACLGRAAAKLETLWEKNDAKVSCSVAGDETATEVKGLVEDWMRDLTSFADYGTRVPTDFPNLTNVVFFAPFCDLDPHDFPNAAEYYDEVKKNRCYPDLLAEHDRVGRYRSHNLYRYAEHSRERQLSWQMVGWPCAEIAERAGLGSFAKDDFDIWLSTEYFSPQHRFVHSTAPYVLPSGAIVADDWDDLTDGEIRHPIDELATGQPATDLRVVTGTSPTGNNYDVHPGDDFWTMGNWTIFQAPNDAPDKLYSGNTSKTVEQWTQSFTPEPVVWGYASGDGEDGWTREVDGVYCFQQRGVLAPGGGLVPAP